MSFILDALKKSELERQRQAEPGMIDARPMARRRGLPVWAMVMAALLVVNLAVLGVVLWRSRASAPVTAVNRTLLPDAPAPRAAAVPRADSAVQPPPAAPASAAEPESGDHFSPLDHAPVYAEEIPVPNEEPAAAPQSPPQEARGNPLAGLAAVPPLRNPRKADPVLHEPEPDPDNEEMLPTLSQVNLTGPQALPELHVDVHVYVTKPADRFVYINMRKYHEGATMQEGPVVEKIRRDGAVLNYRGLRFLLPRQS